MTLTIALMVFGCGSDPEGVTWVDPDSVATSSDDAGMDASTDIGGNGDAGDDGMLSPELQAGAELYGELCASCHGDRGEGGVGLSLQGWDAGFEALRDIIDATMPSQRAELCVGECAERTARYITDMFSDPPEPSACDAGEGLLPKRQMRLLTRREYARTIRDLFGAGDDTCGTHLFEFDPEGNNYSSVHVAGSFNDWASSVAAGGWAMEWDAGRGVWRTERVLNAGRYTYKFVIDGSDWWQDSQNPEAEPDGLGGSNSVLHVNCGSGLQLPETLADRFPIESRPEGYSFDNHASGQVTAIHADEYLNAAEAIAQAGAAYIFDELGCAPGAACARNFAETFGQRAYRRPLNPEEIDRLAALVLAEPQFDEGIEVALRVILSSPNFLYRFELGEPANDGTWTLTPWEIASALSYTFWGTMPDAPLLDAAASGELSNNAGIELQARRLLADARSRTMIETFAVQWLGAERILSVNKKGTLFPGFDQNVRNALLKETQKFISYVVFDGSQNFDELLTADYTLADRTVADFYELPAPSSSDFERVAQDPLRSGILGHASVLGAFAHSDQSSPILRGLFVRERLLCQDLGTPPPSAGGVPDVDPNATTRERFRQHTDDPFCASCHQFIDDIGFGFEHFDPIGHYRETENGLPIDSLGNMNDVEGLRTGTDAPFTTLPELAGVLAESRSAKACFVTHYYRFVVGHLESPEEQCNVERLYNRFAASGFNIQELMISTTQDLAFTRRR